MSTSTSISTSNGVQWGESQDTSLTLWDIDREFQQAYKAYDQWQAQNRRTRFVWKNLGIRTQDDALRKALCLGRPIQKLMASGKEKFGTRFEQGDAKCHTILSAQLIRLQYEVRQQLYDGAFSPTPITIPYEEIIKTARSIRRTCLTALREQYARFQSPTSTLVLPLPRFKVEFCPFADQLRQQLKDKTAGIQTSRLKTASRSDDREVCLHCDACISVTAHSGLPDYRTIIFTSHIALDSHAINDRANFACKSCYKTFDDSYALLDHVFQNRIGSERSCVKKASRMWSFNEQLMETDPSLVELCLKNCLKRELTRARTLKMANRQVSVHAREVFPAHDRRASPTI